MAPEEQERRHSASIESQRIRNETLQALRTELSKIYPMWGRDPDLVDMVKGLHSYIQTEIYHALLNRKEEQHDNI